MITIRLPYLAPPLRSNDRRVRGHQARVVRETKGHGRILGQHAIKAHGVIDRPVTVRIVWEVTDQRVRDAGASSPTLKAILDGMVASGFITSDRHQAVTEERCRIEIAEKPGMRIEIEDA